jgi:Protein of unknown function (DUF402)
MQNGSTGPDDRRTRGAPTLWRSIPDGRASYVYAGITVEDGASVVVLHQPSGAPCKRRTGRRGGPRGGMLPGGWDGGHRDSVWQGAPNVRVHVVGTAMSVIRQWDAQASQFTGWYINLELPWRRTPVGFDSRDLILDVTISDDLSDWQWKDEAHLAWAVETGLLTGAAAKWIRDQGEQAVQRLQGREFPFDADWSKWAPDGDWPHPGMPDDWDRVWGPPLEIPADQQ